MNKSFVNTKFLLPYLGWWIFWTSFQTIILHRLNHDLQLSFIDASLSNLTLALCGYVIVNTYRFYRPDLNNYVYRFAYISVLTILSMISMRWLLKTIFADNIQFLDSLNSTLPIRTMFAFLMISFLDVGNWLWFNLKEQENNKHRKNEAEQLLREAELANLRQQLQPHFLFNSLNSISALAGTKPEEARKMIQQLSDFLRGTLKKDEKQLVLFSSELHHVNLYLEIEKVRFGHRLLTTINCNNDTMKMELPSLLLQPLVENAIKFGLYDTLGEIEISIQASNIDKQLKISITNPFDSDTSKPLSGTGFGLNSVQRRLYLIYGRNDLLTVEHKEDLFVATINIPQKT